jgi:hypothetical protein
LHFPALRNQKPTRAGRADCFKRPGQGNHCHQFLVEALEKKSKNSWGVHSEDFKTIAEKTERKMRT